MFSSKVAVMISLITLGICMYLYFPFPNNPMVETQARTIFMSFPISNYDGSISLGITGSVLFIAAIILLAIGLKKYRLRTTIIVVIAYTILPTLLITMYQETLAKGIDAISYNGEGACSFDSVDEDLMDAKCNLSLHNRSNEAVTFELEFLDSTYQEDDLRMESLMNLAGPHRVTIEANQKRRINFKESLNLSNVPNHIGGGTSKGIHIKIIDGETLRIL
ncbi:hypothetical protein [Thalassobacillus hwangdonensis]